MKTLTRLLPAAAVTLALALTATTVEAYPDQAARVDQQIRPNFGGLITPPLKPRWRPRRDSGYRPGWWGPGGNGNGDYRPPYRDQQSAIVDCSEAREGDTPIRYALDSLVDGGILYLRSRGGAACRESIYIDHPVIIAAEGTSVFDPNPGVASVTLSPPEGQNCIYIASGVKGVELRDLTITTEKAGKSACIEAWDSDVALVRTKVTYWGDGAAVFSGGGKLILDQSVVDAKTWDAAVVAESSSVRITRSRITGEETGLDLTLAVGDSTIQDSGIMYRGASAPSGVGVLVRGLRSGSGMLNIRNTTVCGWRNGVNIDRGGFVDVSRSRFCRNLVGLVSDGELRLTESAIGAKDVGVYVASGRASILRNRFYDWTRTPIWLAQGVSPIGEGPEVDNNWAYFNGPCWDRKWERGIYCQRSTALPAALRDESGFNNPYRDWWEADGYDRGYTRDGAPGFLPPPAPPAPPKKGWGRRSGPAGPTPAPATAPGT